MQIATPEQVAALAAAVGPRWEALVFAAAYSGLRWGELAGLRRCDVDLERNLVTVTRKLGEVNGAAARSARRRPLPGRSDRHAVVRRSVARRAHRSVRRRPGAEGLVFPSADGQPMRRSNFRRRVWEPATVEVGMTGFRFHDLRHTAATLARSERHEPQGAHGSHRSRVGRRRSPVPST